jgi:hypothetical protein
MGGTRGMHGGGERGLQGLVGRPKGKRLLGIGGRITLRRTLGR